MAKRIGILDKDRLSVLTLALPLMSGRALGNRFIGGSYFLVQKWSK